MKRILLVEDDEYIRNLYEEILKGEGFEVVSAEDGEQGLIYATKGGFDLILLDIIMPKKDGVTFLKEYSQLQPKPNNKKIIMLSVLHDDSVIKQCLQLGAEGYLMKSELTPDQILKEVHLHIDSL